MLKERRASWLKDEEEGQGMYTYKEINRETGSGPVRIGESMAIRPDLYSMLFVSSLHAEYIFHYTTAGEVKEESTNKMLTKYRQTRNKDKSDSEKGDDDEKGPAGGDGDNEPAEEDGGEESAEEDGGKKPAEEDGGEEPEEAVEEPAEEDGGNEPE